MVNSIIYKTKKIKLNDIVNFRSRLEKNIFRSHYFFNFKKLKFRKWKFQRSYKYHHYLFFLRRFSPNLTYVPNYNHLVHPNYLDIDNIKINKYTQLFSYKSKVDLKRRLLGFFLIRKTKLLKAFLVFRHITTHFNIFDTNYEVLLLRLGFVPSIKEARRFIKYGVLKINGHIITKTRHLNDLDYVEFSDNLIDISLIDSCYSHLIKKYNAYEDIIYIKIIDYIYFLCSEYRKKMFMGILPFISPMNYATFNFIYFNKLLKNQWHYYINFYVAKKFLQYAR